MKTAIAIILLALLATLTLAACGAPETPDPAPVEPDTGITDPSQNEPAVEQGDPEPDATRIILSVNGETATVELLDNDAASDLVSMLPLSVTFEDYNGIEKIAYLQRELNLGGAPTSCDPDVGSFAYYAPWGNLSVFYNDFRESNNLVPLGTFIDGIEIFAGMSGQFSVTIELE